MSEQIQSGEEKRTFRPYLVDAPIKKVQTLDTINTRNDEKKIIATTYDFATLNAANFLLLIEREKEIKRDKEEIGKDRTRGHFDETKADKILFDAIVKGGERREFGAEAPAKIYTREELLRRTQERKRGAIMKYLECKAKVLVDEDDYDKMFEEGEAQFTVQFSIGDRDEPAYRFLVGYRRAEPTGRSQFAENFAYNTEKRGGDLTLIQTVVDIKRGVRSFDENFTTIIADPELSQVVFRNPEWSEGSADDIPFALPYDDSKKELFLSEFNPSFKVEIAATVNRFINKAEGE